MDWQLKMDRLLKNAIILYTDGSRENYEAISINSRGIYTGKIDSGSKKNNELKIFDHRFIPFENVMKITYIDKNGNEKTSLLKDIREELEK
jgi:hypothetical protein